jgi:hypothetical protein
MAAALANTGQADRAEALAATLREDTHGGPLGLSLYGLGRGDIDQAVVWAGKAAEQRIPAFIPRVVRAYEPLLRRSAAWPELLKSMNLT